MCATEKLTAERYIKMLENEELEGDLCSVFARLRNSEQYWMHPRNELNCMSFYYGPATWYLTLSPSEWAWEDLGKYLRKINPDLEDKSIGAYLLKHFKYNPEQEPEKYFFSMLLLFKPWRESHSLKGDNSSYTEAFNNCKQELMDGNEYHEQLTRLQEANTKVCDLIGERRAEMEEEGETTDTDIPVVAPTSYGCTEVVQGAMEEFNEIFKKSSTNDVDTMISNLNADQLKVFETVTHSIKAQISDAAAHTVRLFVSGCGGTGKSFLIKTIREWVLSTTNKGVAVLAPTGIAAVNINGMTIHRPLMLPVEHGKTPKYRPLSDDALKIA